MACRLLGDYAGQKYSPEPDKIFEWVEEAYREASKLMDLAGLRG